MCHRARMQRDPDTLWGSTGKLFDERPRDNRFAPAEFRPRAGTTSYASKAGNAAGT